MDTLLVEKHGSNLSATDFTYSWITTISARLPQGQADLNLADPIQLKTELDLIELGLGVGLKSKPNLNNV